LTGSQPELIVVSGTEMMLQSVLAADRTIPVVLIAVNLIPSRVAILIVLRVRVGTSLELSSSS
jgi:hypothetical protein